MDDRGMVGTVRSFNRVVTQRVGVLTESYLARGRPLAESRVLWEIGSGGCDVRALRSRLGLDSGYLSRLLRSLEASGLVTVEAGERDRRVRRARLTSRGRKERNLLDRRSDALARSLLQPLGDEQRERLVAAMAQVERLLTASMVEIRVVDPDDPGARYCVEEYFAELRRRFRSGFDPGGSMPAAADELRAPAGAFLLATLDDQPVGCGALKLHSGEPAELKRMWVSASTRGLGIGRRLLAELERRAAEHGSHVVRLETNAALSEAVAMYRSAGYREVEAFNTEPYADHWFEKDLDRRDRREGASERSLTRRGGSPSR